MNWQPIESAPMGADVLLWGPMLGHMVASREVPGGPWMTLDGPDYRADAFSCWQPLPEPPAD